MPKRDSFQNLAVAGAILLWALLIAMLAFRQ
jgi:hypothetical protein